MGRKNRNARKVRRAQRANQMPVKAKAAGTVVEQPEEEKAARDMEAVQSGNEAVKNNTEGVKNSMEAVHNATEAVQESFLDEAGELKCPEQKIELIPIKKILTEGYQRVLNMKNVNKIAKDFDPARLGVLVVNHRADGSYAVLDGQHRLSALRILGIMETNCIVLEGLTLEQEADYFRKQNENKQSLRIKDMFKAATWAGDEESVQIEKIMSRCGFTIGKSGKPMTICAIGALQQIVRLFGYDVLEKTLVSISLAWSVDTVILRREMLAGLGEFWYRFGEQTTPAQFASRMKTKVPVDMLMEAKALTSGKLATNTSFNKTMRYAMCSVMVDHYNKRLGKESKNRLMMELKAEGDE